MALYMGLAESGQTTDVLKALTDDIRGRGNALTAGDIGYRYVLKALSAAGLNDLIYDMNARDDVPGYGYQLRHGATALTERWQALPSVSNNHFMLGHLLEWFYEGLLGIRQQPGSIGYRDLIIAPVAVGEVNAAKGGFRTAYGPVSVDWTSSTDRFALTVNIPPNSTAQVALPAASGDICWMNGRVISQTPVDGKVNIRVSSGKHAFRVDRKK
jgi:hypothetical protein